MTSGAPAPDGSSPAASWQDICDTPAMGDDPVPQTPASAEAPRDVLAAEEFALPAPDPDLHRPDPVELPDDPTGIVEPHDVLAAEEFPIPAVGHKSSIPTSDQ